MIQPAAEEQLATEFAQLRPFLLRVAYSHLGSLSEAEDLVQEAWIRLERTDRAEIRNLRAWLTTVVSRLALDALTSARSRRERFVGPWLPEPLVQSDSGEADPAHRVDLDESVSMALLVVLESLSPAERSAFLLHDVFGYSFNEVAQIVGRTPAAARQLATRGRHAVEARRPRYPAAPQEQREVVAAFQAAAQNGDVGSLIELLDPAVTFRSDGGGVVNAARTVFTGAQRVARIFTAMAGHFGEQFRMRPIVVNGAPGLLLNTGEYPSVIAFSIDQGRINEIDVVRNPEKLGTVLGASASASEAP
ncbi:MAG: RNA polymerase sigma factor SigJ [Solirubrobacteraceae bacterium]